MSQPSDLVLLSATRQLHLLRTGAVSVTELAEAHIAQIERLNPALNAITDFDAERVRAEARRLQGLGRPGQLAQSGQRAQYGQRARSERMDQTGRLHGLPVTVKSSIATAGYRCEIGSALHRGDTPSEDAESVRRLRAAGALILGTTNCPEFLMAYETANLLHGRTRNPWSLDHSPGGSSGGEAAAIAAGMSAAGLGSDSGGSVRQPAHFTGICALKPTPGRVPGRGHLPPCVGPFSILGAIGPMARTIGDLRLLFEALAGPEFGPDRIDPGSAPVPLRWPSLDEARQVRIGWFEDDELVPVTAETRVAVRDAAKALAEAGYAVEPFRPRTLEPLRRLWTTFFVQCGAMFYQPEIVGRESALSPIFQEFLGFAAQAGPLTATELLNAWAELDLLRSKALAEMEAYPIWLCPVASVPAFRHGERAWSMPGISGTGNQTVPYMDAWRFTQWFNALANPAAVVPVRRSPEGLPIGVQVTGRPYADELVLTVAGVLDEAFGYRAPPMS